MFQRNKTFEELIDKIGLAEVFSGTDADEATQEAFQEWLFDYPLCSDNDNTFLRYFRRRFNNLYPRYLEQVRILSIKANFDPYVTDYFQDVIKHNGTENSSSEKVSSGENGSKVTSAKGSGSTTIRTPDLQTHTIGENEIDNDTTSQNSGSDSTSHTGTVTVDRDGTNTTNRTGTDKTETNDKANSTAESKTDGFGIAYPEANLGSIPLSLDAERSIDYANSESISMSKSTTTATDDNTSTVTHNTEDKSVVNETDKTTNDTTDATTYGMKNVGSSTTKGSDETTQTQTGKETTTVTSNGEDVQTTEGTNSTKDTESGERTHSDKETHEHKGRSESVADIVPRAVKAIINTNELMWFIDSMKVCFDCTDFLY